MRLSYDPIGALPGRGEHAGSLRGRAGSLNRPPGLPPVPKTLPHDRYVLYISPRGVGPEASLRHPPVRLFSPVSTQGSPLLPLAPPPDRPLIIFISPAPNRLILLSFSPSFFSRAVARARVWWYNNNRDKGYGTGVGRTDARMPDSHPQGAYKPPQVAPRKEARRGCRLKRRQPEGVSRKIHPVKLTRNPEGAEIRREPADWTRAAPATPVLYSPYGRFGGCWLRPVGV